ncbi:MULTISPECIES: ABC transporter ATP-binding protein [unclassified Streptococcus]|uniref:ABC transporter ATP-binding protein n=1 Tax=unclassified Streptococcus TaxID=2608887 RepID=UPI001071EE82|nr:MULTISPECIES: ABC transporter ATP-binding protein [unclassified Streptococcus]MBF0787152.1 ABC transporter ATP-binding protein [Streptococcus sp. 19428wC2_LYSM12]MCQ9212132.1 ABC transporter ATP-binding protein/permease [Streptococcus sp. B01]MCQ9213461.1 ABC transporter ATP-binding protein/permease [Streptococcus sp. O1]TFV05946.1 ABC transporter ATP-binding protein [Streptococcus sp. LYSM12]
MIGLIIRYVRQHKWIYLLVAITLIVYDACLLVPTRIIQGLVDRIGQGSLTLASLMQDMLILLGVTILTYVTAYIWHLKLFQSSVQFKFDMQQRSFHKLVVMRTPFYEKFRSGDVMTRFSTDVEGLMDMVGYGLMIVVYAGGMIAFIIPTMFFISWQISLAALIPMLILVVAIYMIGQRQEQAVAANREAIADLNDEVLEVVEGIRVTRAYSKKEQQKRKFQERTRNLALRGDNIMALQSLYNPMTTILLGLATIVILGLGAIFLEQGQVSLGQVIALQLYTVSLLEPFWMLSDFILVYQTGKTSFAKLQELVDTGDDMEEDGTEQLGDLREITFQDYDFRYPQADRNSLTGISWTLKAGQTVGIVGKTGSGKTTLIRQLLRQYPIGSGSFTLNGHSILDYKRASIEDKIGYVPQEHVLFSKTVRENIALGKQDSQLDEIVQAIDTADFTKDLERMSEGIETMIGERGVSISGGQKQRISIARAFLRNPDLLILDDSLSAVDARTERQIIENIQRERKGKTNIIVTHRLSAVHHADWVLVLEDGYIIEEGSPAQLLEQGGWYYEQYQRQQRQEGEEE